MMTWGMGAEGRGTQGRRTRDEVFRVLGCDENAETPINIFLQLNYSNFIANYWFGK